MNVLPLTDTATEPGQLPSSTTGGHHTVPPANDKGFVEQVITWASISYAAGFFIVLLHTWRLGLPVLDLVQAVYVWIGIPLAVFAYFANELWRYFRGRLEIHTAALRSSLSESAWPRNIDARVILNVIEKAGPFVLPGFVTLRLLELALSYAREKLSSQSSYGKSALRFFDLLFRISTGISAFFTLLSLIAGAAIVAGILIAYVWIVYPRVPQSLGGGAPARVRLVLDVTKVSPDFSRVAGLGATWNKDGPPILTSELQLLYKTADGFWLVSEGGAPFLLDKSMVLSLMYSDAERLEDR